MHNYSHIYPCPDINGTFTHTFCCDAQEASDTGTSGCCDTRIYVVDFGKVLSGASSVQNSSSATNSSSSTTSATSHPSISSAPPQPSATQDSSSNKAVAIGAGVGVPLGVLLVAGFAYLWYLWHRERTSRRLLEKRLSTIQSSSLHDQNSKTPSEGSTGYDHGLQIQELDYLPRRPELHSQSLVEVASLSRK